MRPNLPSQHLYLRKEPVTLSSGDIVHIDDSSNSLMEMRRQIGVATLSSRRSSSVISRQPKIENPTEGNISLEKLLGEEDRRFRDINKDSSREVSFLAPTMAVTRKTLID